MSTQKNAKVLHLIFQKKYFDKILKGEKKQEYRGYTDFYISKLCNLDHKEKRIIDIKKFDYGLFQLGYSKNAPQLKIEIKEIFCEGEVDENDKIIPEKTQFIIVLGNIQESPENYSV